MSEGLILAGRIALSRAAMTASLDHAFRGVGTGDLESFALVEMDAAGNVVSPQHGFAGKAGLGRLNEFLEGRSGMSGFGYREYQVREANGALKTWTERVNDLSLKGAANAIGWDGGEGPFRIYCRETKGQGPFGFVGQTVANSFLDDNIHPDFTNALSPSLDAPCEALAA